MNRLLKGIVYISTGIVAIVLCTPIFGNLYQSVFGKEVCVFWCPEHIEYIPGFIISVNLVTTLFLFVFRSNKKYLWFMFLVLIDLLIFWGYWDGILFYVSSAVLGLLIGELLARIFRNSNPTRPVDKKLGSKTKRVV